MRMPIKTTHKEIVDYWSQYIYEGDMGTDWSEALNHCWRCGYEHKTKSLHRCHIIAKQFGGEDKASNLVLLCSICHGESPSFSDDPTVIWDWIRRDHAEFYNVRNFSLALSEFERLFGHKPDMENFSLHRFIKILNEKVGLHLGAGQRPISIASYAYAIKKVIEQKIEKPKLKLKQKFILRKTK